MRRKLVIATTAGALTLGGLAVAVPALADADGSDRTSVGRLTDALSELVSDGSLTQEQADAVAGRLSEAGIGGPGGHGPGWGFRGLEVAAAALGMTEDDLRTALQTDGTSLADLAEERGIGTDALVDALETAAREAIAQAVEDGEITQEQADERLAEVEERVAERVADDDRGPGRRPGGSGGPGHWDGGSTD